MRAMMAYMAMRNRGENQQGGNRSEMYGETDTNEMRRGRQPNQYTNRNGMDEDWPQDNGGMEMRRRRDKKGRFMNGGMEDARAYDARSEYRPQGNEYGRVDSRYNEMDDYMPPIMPRDGLYDGGGIGFGTRDREYQTRSHYGGDEYGGDQRQAVQAGGTFWMMPNRNGGEKLDRMTAERWVRGMRNEDSARPSGGKWTMDELKPMAQKFGINTDPDSEEFLEFWVMTNAMYSDYCSVAKDAMPNKTALYYEYIVKKNN